MDWLKAHAKFIPAAVAAVLVIFLDDATAQGISGGGRRGADLPRAQRSRRGRAGLSPGPACARVARVPTADKLWKGILVALMVAGGIGWLVFAVIVALALLY